MRVKELWELANRNGWEIELGSDGVAYLMSATGQVLTRGVGGHRNGAAIKDLCRRVAEIREKKDGLAKGEQR